MHFAPLCCASLAAHAAVGCGSAEAPARRHLGAPSRQVVAHEVASFSMEAPGLLDVRLDVRCSESWEDAVTDGPAARTIVERQRREVPCDPSLIDPAQYALSTPWNEQTVARRFLRQTSALMFAIHPVATGPGVHSAQLRREFELRHRATGKRWWLRLDEASIKRWGL